MRDAAIILACVVVVGVLLAWFMARRIRKDEQQSEAVRRNLKRNNEL